MGYSPMFNELMDIEQPARKIRVPTPSAVRRTFSTPRKSDDGKMAFGRSNSLSLNTGATNSLLNIPGQLDYQCAGLWADDTAKSSSSAQQQNNTTTSQPQQGSSLFGASTNQPQSGSLFGQPQNQQQPQQGGGLFGQQQSQAQQSGGLFGTSTQTSQPQQNGGLSGSLGQQSQPQQSGGLFGASTQQSQPQQGGGLFGASTQQAQNQQGGGLFGSSAQQSQPQQGGGLFGSNTQQSQPQQSGGLFGASTQQSQPQQGGGLFGASAQQSQPQQSGSLFGGSLFGNQQSQTQVQQSGGQQNQQNTGGSLFGNTMGQQQQSQGGGLFGSLGQQKSTFGGSQFGNTINQQQQQQQPSQQPAPSMLGYSLFQSQQGQPFAGGLTMGQGNAQSQQQQTVPGVKIDVSQLRPTTRFGDLHDEIKRQIEEIDAIVRNQEELCKQIEAIMPSTTESINSLKPDVELITEKAEAVESALSGDAAGIQREKAILQNDIKDFERCERVIRNMALPQQFHYPSIGIHRPSQQAVAAEEEGYDTDLVGNYFTPMAAQLKSTLDTYSNNLGEIEGHLRVIEGSAIGQAQQLLEKKAGMGREPVNGEDTVRELAETLQGFERSIMSAAGLVGGCREGVNELVLGKLGGANGAFGESFGGSRRRW